MPLVFHACRHEATHVATANDGVGRHQDKNESTYFYKSLPIKRESVDTVSMMRDTSDGVKSVIDPSKADSHNVRQKASTGRFLAVSENQRLNPEKPKAQLREASPGHILPSLSKQKMGVR